MQIILENTNNIIAIPQRRIIINEGNADSGIKLNSRSTFLFLSVFALTMFICSFNVQGQGPGNQVQWSLVTSNAAFNPRDGAGALVFQDSMWLIGGWHPDSIPVCNDDVWNSADGITWNLVIQNAPWIGRHCGGNVVYDEKMWIIGGDGNPDVWNSEDGRTWNLITDSAPWGKRYKPYVLVFHDTIWFMGGFDCYDGYYATYNDVWYTIDGADWTLATPSAGWAPRGIIHGTVVLDDKIWILGGGLYGSPVPQNETYYNDVWCSSNGINWTCISSGTPWVPRIHHTTAVFDGRMWVMAGHNRNYNVPPTGYLRNDVWYSWDGVLWGEMTDVPWAQTHAASIFVYDSSLWLVAGYLRNEVWKLDLVQDIGENAKESSTNLSCFPNPANEKLIVALSSAHEKLQDAVLSIYNCSGVRVSCASVESGGTASLMIDVSEYPEGLYFLKLDYQGSAEYCKVLVVH